MKNKGNLTLEELNIQKLLDRFLHLRVSNQDFAKDTEHLDEDSLTAFVEGNLVKREAQPVINHLVGCSFCRHITAELVKLDFAFAGESAPVSVGSNSPSRISEVLQRLFSRIFASTDNTVFAHQESEEEDEDAKEK
ncbi:MAG: hypothetical protein M3033_16450 [Acidobacteriota bacterium]|nr:hypothetical protein [Acidobacteriota bacterium]